MPTAGKAPTLDWVLSWGLLCVVTWPSLVVLYLLLNALSFALAASIVKVVPLGTLTPGPVITPVFAQSLSVSAVAPGSSVIAPCKLT